MEGRGCDQQVDTECETRGWRDSPGSDQGLISHTSYGDLSTTKSAEPRVGPEYSQVWLYKTEQKQNKNPLWDHPPFAQRIVTKAADLVSTMGVRGRLLVRKKKGEWLDFC